MFPVDLNNYFPDSYREVKIDSASAHSHALNSEWEGWYDKRAIR